MATQDILQRLEPGQPGMNRFADETFLAAGAVAAGAMVEFDLTKSGDDRVLYVKTAADGPFVGVCAAGADDGGKCLVRTRGIVSASVNGTIAVGDALALVGGELVPQTAGKPTVAIALAIASGAATIEVLLGRW